METTGEKYTDARRAVLMLQSLRAKQPARRRIWEAPPDVLPVPVACDCVLARTPTVVVVAGLFAAYPTCFEFKVQARARRRPDEQVAHFGMSAVWARRVREAGSSEPPPDILRLAIACSNGTTASTLDMPHLLSLSADDPPPERVIWGGGGMSGAGRSEQDYVVWPLPPAGPLVFVAEWPANDIPSTRVEIDGTAILRAGKQAADASAA